MAGDIMPFTHGAECRFFNLANIHFMVTTGMKPAPFGRIDGTGYVAEKQYALFFSKRIGNRCC